VDDWLLDSGSNVNLGNRKESFLELKNSTGIPSVNLGNSSRIRVEGVGRVDLTLFSAFVMNLFNCLYVPGFSRNIISIPLLLKEKYSVLFIGDDNYEVCVILKDKVIIYVAEQLANTLWVVRSKVDHKSVPTGLGMTVNDMLALTDSIFLAPGEIHTLSMNRTPRKKENLVRMIDDISYDTSPNVNSTVHVNSNNLSQNNSIFVPPIQQLTNQHLMDIPTAVHIDNEPIITTKTDLPLISLPLDDPSQIWPLSLEINAITADLLHCRMGHASERRIRDLVNKNMVKGVKLKRGGYKIQNNCTGCAYGKLHRNPLISQSSKTKYPILGKIYSDICGPFNKSVGGGKEYLLVFIDAKTRFSWIYLLKHKSETFSKFLEFKAMVEKESNRKILILHSDKGGEYNSTEFKTYLRQEGIKQEFTCAGTPQQNGVLERFNQTIVEMMRCMISLANLTGGFWGEAAYCANYIIVRCPTSGLEGDVTPYQEWYHSVPNVSHLRIFGCQSHVHIQDKYRKNKLDPKVLPAIFLGYSTERKAWRFWTGKYGRIVESRDAVFYEQALLDRYLSHYQSDVTQNPSFDHFTSSIAPETLVTPPSLHATHQTHSVVPDTAQVPFDTQSQVQESIPVQILDNLSKEPSFDPNLNLQPEKFLIPNDHHTVDTESDSEFDADEDETTIYPKSRETEHTKWTEKEELEEIGEVVNSHAQNLHDLQESLNNLDNQEDGSRTHQNPHLDSPRRSNRQRKATQKLTYLKLGDPSSNFPDSAPSSPTVNAIEAVLPPVSISTLKADPPILSTPKNYSEAMKGPNKKSWEEAMQDELKSIEHHDTYQWVKPPERKQVISGGWVYKAKLDNQGHYTKAKARLVAHGNRIEELDWAAIFAPVVKQKTLRVLLSMAVQTDMKIHKMDVKTAFLHGELEEEVYLDPPKNVPRPPGGEDMVWLLRRSLYGLRQAPRCWNKRLHKFLISLGFRRLESDHGTYILGSGEEKLLLTVYVDDLLLFCVNEDLINQIKEKLSQNFSMVDFGLADSILGMEITRDWEAGTIFLNQQRYTLEILEKFNYLDCKPKSTPLESKCRFSSLQCATTQAEKSAMAKRPYRQAIGTLMYLMSCTRPDLASSLSILSRFLDNPGVEHWAGVQRILQYLRGTVSHGILFSRKSHGPFTGFCDSDWAGDIDDRRSTSGWVVMYGGGAVAWQSKKQKAPAQSSCEAEYVSQGMIACEIVWLRNFFSEIEDPVMSPTTIFSDSQSAIHMAQNPVFHDRSKHIALKWHLTRSLVESNDLSFVYVDTSRQVADALTKPVPGPKLRFCCTAMGVVADPSNPSL
jgi:transposase InsO family protein